MLTPNAISAADVTRMDLAYNNSLCTLLRRLYRNIPCPGPRHGTGTWLNLEFRSRLRRRLRGRSFQRESWYI